jgi:uncharacterized protein YqfB (UPF0267 family)
MNEEELKQRATESLKEIAKLIPLLYPYKDSQWVIDFEDELNKLSIIY